MINETEAKAWIENLIDEAASYKLRYQNATQRAAALEAERDALAAQLATVTKERDAAFHEIGKAAPIMLELEKFAKIGDHRGDLDENVIAYFVATINGGVHSAVLTFGMARRASNILRGVSS